MTDTEMAAAAATRVRTPVRWVEHRQTERDLSDDTFDRAGPFHDWDWRHHVPRRIEDIWSDLSMFERALASEIAQEAADKKGDN